MTIILTFAVLAIPAYIAWAVFTRYRAATGTVAERLWAAVSGSATVAVTYVSAAFTSGVALLDEVPEVKAQLQAIMPGDRWPYVMLAILAATYLARRRTL